MKKRKRVERESNKVLEQIARQNPDVTGGSLELFTEIAYPVAIIEIEMTEVTFENFDAVQLTVLQFIDSGVYDAESIAYAMGLSRSYIQNNIDLLMGYGYIDDRGLTNEGKEALEADKKISRHQIRQRFKADALTGELLRVAGQPEDEEMRSPEKVSLQIAHVPHIDGVFKEDIETQIRKGGLLEYKRYKGDILSSNVDEIKDIICTGIEYTTAFMLKQYHQEPKIYLNYYYPKERNAEDRYIWKTVEIEREDSKKIIRNLYNTICEDLKAVANDRLIDRICKVYPFNKEAISVDIQQMKDGIPEQVSVFMGDDAITEWNIFLIKMLLEFDMVRGYLYTCANLHGMFLRFRSSNKKVFNAASELKKAARIYGKKRIISFYRNKISNMEPKEKEHFDFEEILDVGKLLKEDVQ